MTSIDEIYLFVFMIVLALCELVKLKTSFGSHRCVYITKKLIILVNLV